MWAQTFDGKHREPVEAGKCQAAGSEDTTYNSQFLLRVGTKSNADQDWFH